MEGKIGAAGFTKILTCRLDGKSAFSTNRLNLSKKSTKEKNKVTSLFFFNWNWNSTLGTGYGFIADFFSALKTGNQGHGCFSIWVCGTISYLIYSFNGLFFKDFIDGKCRNTNHT